MTSSMLSRLQVLALSVLAMVALASCAVDDNNQPTSGATSYGTLASSNMSDYYYPKTDGYTYVYSYVEQVKDLSNNQMTQYVSTTCDTMRTLGYQGMTSPLGDSLFAFTTTYRLLSSYAGRGDMDVAYVQNGNGNSSNGAFLDCAPTGISNVVYVTTPKPKPVGTDTILAGMAGRIKSMIDPLTTSSGTRIWQTDTLWFTGHSDSVIIWQRQANGSLMATRQLFYRNFQNGNQWQYGLWEGSTYFKVLDNDVTVTNGTGTWRCCKIDVKTPDINAPIDEQKWFGCGVGLLKQQDHWFTTATGGIQTADKKEHWMTRELVSITAP